MNLLPPPGPQRTRQLAVLGVLVVVMAIYFGRQYWPTAASPAATSKTVAGDADRGKTQLVLPGTVNTTDLEVAPPGSETVRNPFRFGEPPPRPLPPPPPPQPQPIYTPPPPPPPAVPQVPLKCMSILTVTGTKQRMASMIDPETGAPAQWMRDGDVFDGRYKIVKVNETSVVVSFLDGSGQRTVPVER